MEKAFTDSAGTLVAWRNGSAIEDELFLSLTDDGVNELIDLAVALHGEDLIDQHITSASGGNIRLGGDSRRWSGAQLLEYRACSAREGGAFPKGWLVQVRDMDGKRRPGNCRS